MSTSNTTDQFIEHLKSQYDKEFEIRQNLDNKANNMIATAGTVTGLLFGFGTFLVTNIDRNYIFLNYAMISLIVAIIATIVSVFLSMISSRIRTYNFVMKHDSFFLNGDSRKKGNGEDENYNENAIEEYKKMATEGFQDIIIHDFLASNKHNSEINDSKAVMVVWSQRTFMVGLVIITILVLIVLHAFMLGSITITK